ncbi:succinate dehydrogenase cytochrome b subunit [Haloglycomyces albus]|uniref:succinate dehydrogenase cytochrome b subunit n=1 Tax=Haloglycomyces albus TaxID=526067 RepID=UPI003CCB7D25
MGAKITMAVSGLIMVAYLIVHMLGNLKAFAGAADLDKYAEGLRSFGEPILPHEGLLWIVRVVLLASVIAHIASAVVLTRRAKAARPVKYAHRPPVKGEGSYAARTMRWGGVIIFLFVVWHLLDLTLRVVNPVDEVPDVYNAVVQGFAPERWWVTIFYVLAVIFVSLHVRHGIWSAVQTIAGPGNAWRRRTQIIAWVTAVVLLVGFLVVPLSVTFGLVS